MMDDGVGTNYNALRASVQHRFDHGFTLLAVYTYSKCLQDTEMLSNKLQGSTRSNPYSRMADYGPCDYDLRHNFTASFVYAGYKFKSYWLNFFAGGWSPAFLVSAYNGFPFSPMTGTDASLSEVGLDRPNLVPGVDRYNRSLHNSASVPTWINRGAYVTNPPGTFGNVGMNSLVGPGYKNTDVTLSKYIPVHEQQNFQLRFEFFNVFNQTNFMAPVNSLNSGQFGRVQAANPARIIQLAAKYNF